MGHGRTAPHRPPPRGVTLTELMVTVAVAVLLLAVAAPSFMEQIERQRLKSVNEELIAALHLTRMETISRNARGFIKPGSNDNYTCYVFAINSATNNTPPEGCDCGRPDDQAVCSSADAKLLGVVKVPRSTGVTVVPDRTDPVFVYFNRASGTLEKPVGDVGLTELTDFGFDVRGSRGGHILTVIGKAGRPTSCQVGSTSLGMRECAD
jgi:prepilin-type N-terminal cleavage/methylation domain-containing protein